MKRLLKRAINAYTFFWAGVPVRHRRPLIIGVTGSVGKTTTKEVIGAALMHEAVRPLVGRVWKTPGNMNDDRGFPLALLGFRGWPRSRVEYARWLCEVPFRSILYATCLRYPRVLVLEYGAGPDSDIERTASIAPPTVAVVTAVGPAHLELFGTVESVAHTKGALVRAAAANGLVVLGGDNPHASAMDRYARATVVKVAGKGRLLSENIARAVCEFVGVPATLVERVLRERPAVSGRLDVLELGSFTVIDDSYNANPMSMQHGLDALMERARPGQRRVAILGQMRELGVNAESFHHEVGACARERADLVVGVGALAKLYEPEQWFATSDECAESLPRLIRADDCIFVKGSHSVRLETVVRELKRLAEQATGAAHTLSV